MNPAEVLLSFGALLLAGLAIDLLGKKTFLPRVTLLLLFGMLIGEELLDLVPKFLTARFELIADMALLMIGFLLGGKLTMSTLKQSGKTIVTMSVFAAVMTTLMVAAGLLLVGTAVEIAILIGCIASATAPAATAYTVFESGEDSRFTRILLSVVALDDAWALILFSSGIAVVNAISAGGSVEPSLMIAVRDIGGAVVLGAAIGFPASMLTGRIKEGQPMLSEALGIVLLCGGLALYFEVSFLIASMVMGMIIANFAQHHEYPFNAIEGIEWPFLVVFFVLAGASLEFEALPYIGLTGGIYIVSRIAGKITGAAVGGIVGGADSRTRSWLGVALLPQAGAAMGMALAAANYFPEYRQTILSLIIGTTVFFELVGPLFTRLAIRKTSKK